MRSDGDLPVFVCPTQGKDMFLLLENNMLNLVDPMDRSVLHSQPIASIRVWGVGRDNGRLVTRWFKIYDAFYYFLGFFCVYLAIFFGKVRF